MVRLRRSRRALSFMTEIESEEPDRADENRNDVKHDHQGTEVNNMSTKKHGELQSAVCK